MAEFWKAARTEGVPPGHGKIVKVSGKHIALLNIDGNYFAIDDALIEVVPSQKVKPAVLP
jgi:nitrite reductase/ring-hydroxylating ferredoxin subunit